MAEQQVADGQIPEDNRGDALGQSGMALVCVVCPPLRGDRAGRAVTAAALVFTCRDGADQPAEEGRFVGICGELAEFVVKNGDADLREIVKIPQQRI